MRLRAACTATIEVLNDKFRRVLSEGGRLLVVVGGAVAAAARVVGAHAIVVVIVECLGWVKYLTQAFLH